MPADDGPAIMRTEPVSAEEFKPIPIRREPGFRGRLGFALRMAADLQLLTCVRFLRPRLARLGGSVLDVGCGEMPFRSLLPAEAYYIGLDVPAARDFGMRPHADIVAFDGCRIPFRTDSFDCLLCTEVLEHAEQPEDLVAEMLRVLKPGGVLLATVPFAARVHHAPHDYHRFTRFRLAQLFAGFEAVQIEERGDDLAVIANKLIVLCARLARPTRLPLLLLAAPFAAVALLLAHLSLWLGWGSRMDPLGYGVVARKA